MKLAAYQAPLPSIGSFEALDLIRERIRWCEGQGVDILCCPEGILGGLADYADDPRQIAISTSRLGSLLAPLASNTVTTIFGFTELAEDERLYNTAAIYHRGAVAGLYRKQHPAINRSVYDAGTEAPVFQVQGLTFGIVICNDSNFPELAELMAAKGATVLFIPSNCGLPADRFGPEIVEASRKADRARAMESRMWVVRADVAGRIDTNTHGELLSYGSTSITDPSGRVVQIAQRLCEDLIVMELAAEHGREQAGEEYRR